MENLRELFEAMRQNDPNLPKWDSLPTFGGAEPLDTEHVWSWNATHQIEGTCSQDLKIVEKGYTTLWEYEQAREAALIEYFDNPKKYAEWSDPKDLKPWPVNPLPQGEK